MTLDQLIHTVAAQIKTTTFLNVVVVSDSLVRITTAPLTNKRQTTRYRITNLPAFLDQVDAANKASMSTPISDVFLAVLQNYKDI